MSKKILIILISVALVVLAAVVWWLTKPAEQVPLPPPSTASTGGSGQTVTPQPPPLSPQEVAKTNVKNSALRFAEIFGSYSTDVPFGNLKAVDSLITSSMRQTLEATKATASTEGFYGVTTKALIAKIQNETEELATVIVSTQRLEAFSSANPPQARYQDIMLTMVRSGNSWLVDRAVWQ